MFHQPFFYAISMSVGNTQQKNQKLRSIAALFLTLTVIHLVGNPILLVLILLPYWYLSFRPWSKAEYFMFLLASGFFFLQNYAVLKTGGFSFKHKDILLMPYYEPFLWGFYYLTIKRFISEQQHCTLHLKAFLGLVLTGLAFSFFSHNSGLLLISTLVSTGVLLVLFHELYDFYYALCAFILGFIIELFGVSTGLWAYPEPDFLGIPFWFATMWISVGILGRRLLIPLSEWLAKKVSF